MWFIYALITFTLWAVADLFYKKGAREDDQYSHLKTGMMVGIVMGIHALIYAIINNLTIDFMNMIKYLPVSLFYIISMVIGYKGLRYIELSISSPIQNSSGIITAILLFIIFRDPLSLLSIIGILIIGIGIAILSYFEGKAEKDEVNNKKIKIGKKVIFLAIFFPLIYCILDGAGTFLDAIYLDKLEILSEDEALIAYESTFFIYAIIIFIYLKLLKKEDIGIFKVKERIIAAGFETFGQVAYVYAMATNSVLSAPIVASYAAGSLILARVFLKEKLDKKQFVSVLIVLLGIILLGISEGLNA